MDISIIPAVTDVELAEIYRRVKDNRAPSLDASRALKLTVMATLLFISVFEAYIVEGVFSVHQNWRCYLSLVNNLESFSYTSRFALYVHFFSLPKSSLSPFQKRSFTACLLRRAMLWVGKALLKEIASLS